MQSLLDKILTVASRNGASDVHLKAGSLPRVRINGVLYNIENTERLTRAVLEQFLDIMPATHRAEFDANGDSDYAYSLPGVGRFRVNTFMQRGSPSFAFRIIPSLNFDIDSIGLPKVVSKIALENRGLTLVTGITGSGKSTTLAAMIDYINKNKSCNVITLEDPIEFLHSDKKSSIVQRQIGEDTVSFSEGLRRALRQDPDVILVGEIRDTVTMETALHAAQTGHLVLATMHTLDSTETLNRIIAMFPPHQQGQIRVQLAGVLNAVISQRLVPNIDGTGRVPAVEVMISTAAIKDCILEPNKTSLIEDFIKQGRVVYQSQTFDQSLYDLVSSGKVSEEEAMNWVKRKDDFKLMMQGISGTGGWDPNFA